MREFLTAAELAERLRVRTGTIRAWGRVGRIPVVRLSPRALRFDFEAVVKSLTRNGGDETSTPSEYGGGL
jgi:excisionase family DNA binding protein